MLVFFGFVATVGSAYVQIERVPGAAWWGSLVVGLLACAILLANNLRDIPTDTVAGKRTLAVRVGVHARRAGCSSRATWVVRVGRRDRDHAAVGAAGAGRAPARGDTGAGDADDAPIRRRWSRVLVATSRLELVVAVLVSVGLCLS